MNENCIDLFSRYNLPFKTYFAKKIEHLDQTHDESELIWVLKGNLKIICDGIPYQLTSQTLFMVNDFQVHSLISSEDAMIVTLRFTKEHLKENKSSFEGMSFISRIYTFDELVDKYKEMPQLISLIVDMLMVPNNSYLIRYKIIGYYNILMYELYTLLLRDKYLDIKQKNCKECLNRLNTVIDYVSLHFKEKITLEEIAQEVEISRFRLSHFIKENLGISFTELLNSMRFEYALKQLRETDQNVLKISEKSGFSDVKYLNKMVKKRFNMTALKYRKMIGQQNLSTNSEKVDVEHFLQDLKLCLSHIQDNLSQSFS
ncbi:MULTISPECIES: AraC family transcriptional regulator [unclassified Oceanispirochaeta]|uniref:AraC family transcriptional regulator n=1 Tax=unclassified Oceanispirochaeta TaxID=2635722 RepID=UPI000E094CD1|nr:MULTISPECIES: AraC family transcriptional regulator [unclassified Oceanispirochaeta]MBF9018551.1 helix-turn-helix transcriptional regulator [Oceanispirochaeta sp. M2]NPD74958.1 helix-turn-helix transcriptional regulator [Oceanispirochaeta sp. M1]RDG29189.1 AraC family transcriptional regulator [Oceanispirochaeta sp. M1]